MEDETDMDLVYCQENTKACELGGDMCNIRLWCFAYAFTLSFSPLFAKTWRVHKIFNNVKMRKQKVNDAQLFKIVGSLCLLVGVYLAVWTAVDRMTLTRTYDSYIMLDDVKSVPYRENCASEMGFIWTAVLFGGMLMMVSFGAFLAYEARNARIPAMNDAKETGFAIYNVLFLGIIIFPVSLMVKNNENAHYILSTIGNFVGVTGIITVLFVPKMFALKSGWAFEEQATAVSPDNATTLKTQNTYTGGTNLGTKLNNNDDDGNDSNNNAEVKRLKLALTVLRKEYASLQTKYSQVEAAMTVVGEEAMAATQWVQEVGGTGMRDVSKKCQLRHVKSDYDDALANRKASEVRNQHQTRAKLQKRLTTRSEVETAADEG
jgi:hypothetical protein